MSLVDFQGRNIDERAQLEAKSRRLSDGRDLIFREKSPFGLWFATRNGLRVLASMDDTPHGRLLHVSVSYANRDPSWADIKAVRDAFFPSTVDAMMLLPKSTDYVNFHEHTFHLWQTPVEWGVQ